jgi:hypothetical protein
MTDNKWDKESIKNLVTNFATAQCYQLTEITQKIDHALPSTELSRWMDTINGHPGGWFHRAKHGHDFLANVDQVYDKFGVEGVAKYPFELLKDATTPHGIPAPGTQFLVESGTVSSKFATEWLSMNVADVFSGGLAVYSTYKLYKKTKNGELDDSSIMWAAIGVGVKITAGVVTTNPILILSGVADTAILISNFDQAKKAFKNFLDYALSEEALASYSAVITGAGVAALTTTTVAALGTASTGTAIATLGGAAATNATLAAIGGGSLAAGGFGIAGGLAILSGGSVLLGVSAGYGIYKLLKKKTA